MCSPNNIKHKSLGRLNSIRKMNSTLKGSAVVVLGGLAVFRPVPSIGKWVLCLLLLGNGDAGVGDGSKMSVCYVEPVGGLDCGGSEAACGGGFLDEEKVEQCDKQDEGGEQVEHES